MDELGFLAFDNRNADLIFQVVSRRYEKKSLVLTTNLALDDWHTDFPKEPRFVTTSRSPTASARVGLLPFLRIVALVNNLIRRRRQNATFYGT